MKLIPPRLGKIVSGVAFCTAFAACKSDRFEFDVDRAEWPDGVEVVAEANVLRADYGGRTLIVIAGKNHRSTVEAFDRLFAPPLNGSRRIQVDSPAETCRRLGRSAAR